MIKVITGDLLGATEDIIGHQVNCQGVMGSGVALLIRNKWPKAYVGYLAHCATKSSLDLLGTHIVVSSGTGKLIAHLFGQKLYGRDSIRYTNESALCSALRSLKVMAKATGLSIALPYGIGCGRGNGDWPTVYGILEDVFQDYEVSLYLRPIDAKLYGLEANQ